MNETVQNYGGGRGLLTILSLCSFFIGLDSLVVSPLIPQILNLTNTSLEQGGLLITAYALFYGLTAPLFGPISDKVGRKSMIVTGMLIFSIGTFFTGISNDFDTILVFRAVTGISGAIVMPSIFALVGDKFSDKERGKAMGKVMGAMIGSTVLGVPIGAFISELVNWQMTFRVIGFIAFLVFFITLIGLPKTRPQNQISVSPIKTYFGQFKTAFTNPSVLYALLTTLLWTIGLHTMFAYIGVFYNEKFNLSAGGIGIVIFIAGLASVIGNILGGKWSDKIGKKKVVYFASLLSAVFVLIFSSLTVNLVLTVLMHVLWSTSIGVGQSSLTTLISQLSPKVRGTVMSLNSSAMYLGMTIASGSASLILVDFTFLALGVLCAVSATLVLPVIRKIIITENTSGNPPEVLSKVL
ncbi:MFS transporter [Paenibacillus alginolyticus]|uniref:MFS transporter n=1 Tax=Paenibacillus alginolyticus TaxID=59839 RepID=UPI00041F088F|nr:MFS transporter [Paenibacillus alginolyticus]MCY9666497.1 MFS transporter [Paenibacillus alginolyticus]